MTDGPRERGAQPRRPSFGPPVAALVVAVIIFSFAATFALDGVPNTENGLFYAMAEVAGIDLPDVVVISSVWLWVARLAGVGMLVSLAMVFVVRKQLSRQRGSA